MVVAKTMKWTRQYRAGANSHRQSSPSAQRISHSIIIHDRFFAIRKISKSAISETSGTRPLVAAMLDIDRLSCSLTS
jgi:hypothetical protein